MTNKISIKGTAPKFDEQELKQHIAARHAEYYGSQESHVHVRSQFLYDMITKVIELTAEGYILSKQYPLNCAQLQYDCFMRKPDKMIAEELTIIDAQTKQSYVAWLESERESYKQQLTAQLIQTAQDKEAKRLADKQAKVLADILAEVDATFAPLVIPE
jgi:murein L,D-transpeptidase YcbB/YkuD